MAGIEGKTLNGMLVRVVGQGLLWRRRIMESYVRGEVPQEKTIALLEVRQASASQSFWPWRVCRFRCEMKNRIAYCLGIDTQGIGYGYPIDTNPIAYR